MSSSPDLVPDVTPITEDPLYCKYKTDIIEWSSGAVRATYCTSIEESPGTWTNLYIYDGWEIYLSPSLAMAYNSDTDEVVHIKVVDEPVEEPSLDNKNV